MYLVCAEKYSTCCLNQMLDCSWCADIIVCDWC